MSRKKSLIGRRAVIISLGALALAGGAVAAMRPGASQVAAGEAGEDPITVWKSPTCSCCQGWVSHLERNGFAVHVIELEDLSEIKASRGVPEELEACHTAEIAGYVIEGHVPAAAIRQLLASKPSLAGIALPGMPAGSPGMSGPVSELTVVGFKDGALVSQFWTGRP